MFSIHEPFMYCIRRQSTIFQVYSVVHLPECLGSSVKAEADGHVLVLQIAVDSLGAAVHLECHAISSHRRKGQPKQASRLHDGNHSSVEGLQPNMSDISSSPVTSTHNPQFDQNCAKTKLIMYRLQLFRYTLTSRGNTEIIVKNNLVQNFISPLRNFFHHFSSTLFLPWSCSHLPRRTPRGWQHWCWSHPLR